MPILSKYTLTMLQHVLYAAPFGVLAYLHDFLDLHMFANDLWTYTFINRSLKVPYAKLGLQMHPFLSVLDFAKFLLTSEIHAWKLLAGYSLGQEVEWKAAFASFWGTFRALEPQHEVYDRHGGNLQHCVPVVFHGDEGTSFGKKGLFEFSWTPLLSAGASGISRYFLISQLPHKFYGKLSRGNQSGNAALDALMKAGVDSMLQAFVHGVECGPHRFFLVALGLTGDHVFHATPVCTQAQVCIPDALYDAVLFEF